MTGRVRDRTALIVAHTGRRAAAAAAAELCRGLTAAGIEVRVLSEEAAAFADGAGTAVAADAEAAAGVEVVVAVGGDGTLLRAAEFARPAGAALLGVNLGHVGFLAEIDRDDLATSLQQIVGCEYDVEERQTLDVLVRRGDEIVASEWALNDASVEKAARHRTIDLMVEVDGRPLSRWTGDGLVCATPTGSTAYAFSAGGPLVWPSVAATLIVPISAHALFARPLVVSPDSRVVVELRSEGEAVAFFDGRRTVDLRRHDRIEVRRGALPIRLVRFSGSTFTDRLVTKFRLPVRGWRARADDD